MVAGSSAETPDDDESDAEVFSYEESSVSDETEDIDTESQDEADGSESTDESTVSAEDEEAEETEACESSESSEDPDALEDSAEDSTSEESTAVTETVEEIASGEANELLSEVVNYHSIELSNNMAKDHYTIRWAGEKYAITNVKNEAGDDIWYFEEGGTELKVKIKIADGYALDGCVTADIGSKEAEVLYDPAKDIYTVRRKDAPGAVITEDVYFGVAVKKGMNTGVPTKLIPFVVSFGTGVKVPQVIVDGMYVEPSVALASNPETLSDAEFEIDENKTANVIITPEDGFALDEVKLNNVSQPGALKSGKLSVPVKPSTQVTVTAKAAPAVYVANELYVDKSVVNLGSKANSDIRVRIGMSYQKIDSCEARQSGKTVKNFAFIDDSVDTRVKIDASAASTLGAAPVSVKITGASFGTKEVIFSVAQAIDLSKVSIKGFKNYKVTQDNGTYADYKINLNKGADTGRIYLETDYGKYIELDTDDKDGGLVLKVWTYDDEMPFHLAPEKMTFGLKDKATGKTIGEEYTIDVATASIPAPTVKVKAVSDIDMTLSITPPKGAEKYQNLYYVITASATDKDDDSWMVDDYHDYIPYNKMKDTYRMLLTKSETETLGQGGARGYDISVGLFQVKNDELSEGIEAGEKFGPGNLLQDAQSINYKILKKQSTRAPYYESSLSLNKKTTSLIKGERKVLLAEAKFSKKTSYTKLSYATINASGDSRLYTTSTDPGVIKITKDGLGVELVDSSGLVPGKYMLTVSPYVGIEAGSIPATMTFTVKPSVSKITISTPSTTVYKAMGKAVTVKFNAKAECIINSKNYKPANSKLEWSICYTGSDELRNALKINKNNGTVTLDKDFVLSSDPDKNLFKVMATAADLGDRGYWDTSEYVTITNSKPAPCTMTIGGIDGAYGKNQPEGVYSNQINGFGMVIRDINGDILYSPSNHKDMKISISPKSGMTVKDGNVNVTKTGTYTIKAVTKDGTKKSISAKFKVIPAPLKESDPYTIVVNGYKNDESELVDLADGAEVSDISFLSYMVIANTKYGSEALAEGKPSIGIKGAKEFKHLGSAAGLTFIKPNKNEVVITVTDKTVKNGDKNYSKTHRIKIKDSSSLGTITVPKNCSIWKNSSQYVTFDMALSGVEFKDLSGTGKKYVLKASPYEPDMGKEMTASAAYGFCNFVVNSNSDTIVTRDTSDTNMASMVTLGINTGNLSGAPNVSAFNCYLILCIADEDDKVVSILTKPAKFTIKPKKAPAVKAALNTKVTYAADADSVPLKFKIKKNVANIYGSYNVYNDIVNGKPNEFTKYFDVKKTPSNDFELVKKDGAKLTPGTKMSFIIEYDCVGPDESVYNCITKYERIIVTIGKPKN